MPKDRPSSECFKNANLQTCRPRKVRQNTDINIRQCNLSLRKVPGGEPLQLPQRSCFDVTIDRLSTPSHICRLGAAWQKTHTPEIGIGISADRGAINGLDVERAAGSKGTRAFR